MEENENGVSTELELEREVKERLLTTTREAKELYDNDVSTYLRGLGFIDDHSPITANFKENIRRFFVVDKSDGQFNDAINATQSILKG